MRSVDEQLRIIENGAEQVLPEGELATKLTAVVAGDRRPLRVKLGVDPTSPDIHLGHTVVLRKLRDFQRLGHTAVLIIGGFTARVGDPSGRSTTRPRLTSEEVTRNAATYLRQVRKVLLPEPLEVVDNAAWLAGMTMEQVLGLTAQMTVARVLERQDFAQRYAERRPIAVSEFLYPLLQGQDSVAVNADVELGGTDQTFNLLVGRDLQVAAGQDPQCVVTLPLIEGLDGAAKMSKTSGNTIGVDESAEEMFGKAMSLRDELMVKYFRLVTDVHPDDVDAIAAGLAEGRLHPGQTKRRLAREIVSLYHSPDAADRAEARFDTQFKARSIPDDVPEVPIGDQSAWFLPSLLQHAGLVTSGGEARRMVGQGAVRLDGEVLTEATADLPRDQVLGRVLQVGKRRFARMVP